MYRQVMSQRVQLQTSWFSWGRMMRRETIAAALLAAVTAMSGSMSRALSGPSSGPSGYAPMLPTGTIDLPPCVGTRANSRLLLSADRLQNEMAVIGPEILKTPYKMTQVYRRFRRYLCPISCVWPARIAISVIQSI